MKQNDTSYRTKGRAVFLAAIMVLSVVAMSTAFVGGAAAVEPKNELNTENKGVVYPGQVFNVSVNTGDFYQSVNLSAGASDDTAYLVEVETDGGNVDRISTIRTLNNESESAGTWFAEVDTEDLETGNDYAITNRPSFSSSASEFTFNFTTINEGFSIEFDDDFVDETDDASALELDSDRSLRNYNVTVSVDGPDNFDADMINETFNVSQNSNYEVTDPDYLPLDKLDDYERGEDDVSDLRDDGYVTLNLAEMVGSSDVDGDDLMLNFERLADGEGLPDEGEYEFTFFVTDTGATATDTIFIGESDSDGSFSAGTYQAVAGDIAMFEFELEDTDEAWIQIGDADSDFVDILYVDVDDEDEPVEVKVNTRLLGTSQDLDADEVYDVENADGFESAYHSVSITSPDSADLFEDDGTSLADFDAYVDALGITDQANKSLTRPLQPFDYELQIAGTDGVDALFDADSGAGEANDLLDSAVLELVSPSIGDITIHTAPEENADDVDEISELVSAATARDEIAHDDRLIVQVEATGLYGALVAGAENENAADVEFDRLNEGFSSQVLYNLIDTTNESIDFEIVGDGRTGNQDPLEVDLENGDDSDTYVLIDNEGGQFFVVVNTGSDTAFANGDAPDSDVSFTAMLEYDADNDDDRYEFEGDENPDPFSAAAGAENYPYLLVGDVLTSSAEFDLVEPEVSFNNLNADDEVQAENIEDAVISGTTNIAPGSDAELRVSSTDASTSFRIGQDVDINEDGEISAMFDFSGQEVGDEFDTRFRASGTTIDTVDSVIVAEGDLGVADPVEDDDEDVDDDEPVDDDEDVVDDDDDEEEPTDDETPGFGVLVALIALIGAALLAVRRQD